jgi:hypothetical protein
MLLTGCASEAAPTPTVTVTSTVSATPEAQPESALSALDAWNACSSAAQAAYVLGHSGSAVVAYSESRAPQKNADGSFSANVGITPAPDTGVNGGIVAICTVKGTHGSPEIVSFTLKDI